MSTPTLLKTSMCKFCIVMIPQNVTRRRKMRDLKKDALENLEFKEYLTKQMGGRFNHNWLRNRDLRRHGTTPLYKQLSQQNQSLNKSTQEENSTRSCSDEQCLPIC